MTDWRGSAARSESLGPLRGALGARLLARFLALGAGLLAVGRIIGSGERGRCGRAGQQEGDQEVTHDSDLSSVLRRPVLLGR